VKKGVYVGLALVVLSGCGDFRLGFPAMTPATGGQPPAPTSAKVIYRNHTGLAYPLYYVDGPIGSTLNCSNLALTDTVPAEGTAQVVVPPSRSAWIRVQTSTETAGCSSKYTKAESWVVTSRPQSVPEYVDID
jgi:hypothetical protein